MLLAIHGSNEHEWTAPEKPRGMVTLLSAGRGWQKDSLRGFLRVARMYKLISLGSRRGSGESRGFDSHTPQPHWVFMQLVAVWDLGSPRSAFGFQYHLLLCLWESYLTSLSLSFLDCKILINPSPLYDTR